MVIQYARTEERAKVLDRYPDYAVEIAAAEGVFVARVGELEVARSDAALEVRESFHAPVIYFPPQDIDFTLFEASSHRTRCPFKGDASYHDLVAGELREANLMWCYPQAMPEVAGLEGYHAFYADRVTVRRDPDA